MRAPGRTLEQPINARPSAGAAVVAAVSTALAPYVVPPAANAAPTSPTDIGSFSTADLQAIVATRATHAPRADRAVRTLEPRLRPPGALGATAVAVAVAPPPAPPVPVVPAVYVPKHAAPPRKAHNGYGNGGGHYVAPPAYSGGRAQVIVDFVLSQVGGSYRMGATGPNVWDCSGLSRAAAALVGVSLPHNADAQRAYVRSISRAELQPGDLVFYPSHVAVYIGNGMQVAAANVREGVVRQAVYGTPSMYGRL